jgi:hypothetical protein
MREGGGADSHRPPLFLQLNFGELSVLIDLRLQAVHSFHQHPIANLSGQYESYKVGSSTCFKYQSTSAY